MKIPDYKLNNINDLYRFYVTRVGGKTDLLLTREWKPLCKKFIYFYPKHPDLRLSNLGNLFHLDTITSRIVTSTILLHNESFPEITYKDSPIRVSLVNSHRATKLKLQGILNDYDGTYSVNLYRVFGEDEDGSYKNLSIGLFDRIPIEILLEGYKKHPKIINLGYIKLKKYDHTKL